MKRIRLFLAAVLIVLAGVGGSLAPAQTASAAYWWETVYGPITGEGVSLGEGACSGHDPHWINQPWGWTCPSSKGKILRKHCHFNPFTWFWEVRVEIANAEIHWNIYGNKWFNRTTSWASYLVDRRPWAASYCITNHPYYF